MADQKTNHDLVKEANIEMAKFKKILSKTKKARGMTRNSLINRIELVSKAFNASKEVYHGGDYNGKSVLKVIAHAK
jgi:predicted small secreted protein